MTARKTLAKAKAMPNFPTGHLTPYMYISPTSALPPMEVTICDTFRLDSIARARTSEAITAAMFAGCYLSVDDTRMQERWEKILAYENL